MRVPNYTGFERSSTWSVGRPLHPQAGREQLRHRGLGGRSVDLPRSALASATSSPGPKLVDKKRIDKIDLKVFVKPLINLIWVAGFVFVAGSLIAMWPDAIEQRRLAARYAAGAAPAGI